MKIVFIKKDSQERYNLKRAWFVNAWRIVNDKGEDQIQPWSNTKKDALETIKNMGWAFGGMYAK